MKTYEVAPEVVWTSVEIWRALPAVMSVAAQCKAKVCRVKHHLNQKKVIQPGFDPETSCVLDMCAIAPLVHTQFDVEVEVSLHNQLHHRTSSLIGPSAVESTYIAFGHDD